MKILICRETNEDGSIRFAVYDTDEETVQHFTNSELIPLVVGKKVSNAKLENSVIKITDGSHSIIKLTAEESKMSSAFYILERYTSPHGSEMYLAVDNTGIKYEFSENLLTVFSEKKRVVNLRRSKNGHEMIKVPVYSSVLQKSLAHTNIH